MSAELWRWNAVQLAEAIRTREISCKDAVTAALARLDAVNAKVNAVPTVLAEDALAAAGGADAQLKRGEPIGPLHGVPVTIKENVDQAGLPTINGVRAFQNTIAATDSPPVANWKRAGAIVIGRTATPCFSLRWHTESELWGPTLNPWDRTRTPGGSSGGAAVATALGIAPLAHGSDYFGSIRYPAYCCGVAGIRPTLGRVPSFNGTAKDERPPTAQLFAVQGPIARRVRDLRLGLHAMAASDIRDPWWLPAPLTGPEPARPIRVALTANPGGLGANATVADAVRRAGHALEQAGYRVEEVEPPSVEAIADLCWRLVWTETRHLVAPAIRKLGDAQVNRAVDMYLASVPETDLASFIRDSALRAKHLRDWMAFMERYPLVVGPVSTEPPMLAGFDVAPSANGAELMRIQRLMIAVNLLGLPAVAVPVGVEDGVPNGVQVIGARFREDMCLDAAEAIEAQCGVDTPIDVQWPNHPS